LFSFFIGTDEVLDALAIPEEPASTDYSKILKKLKLQNNI